MPNLPAARDARGRSACYPRSTFYLLSDGLSIQHRRITNADFRPCSSHRTRSQAPFYVCAPVARLPTGPRVPWRSSVTLWEETAPVKLPTKHCPPPGFTGSGLESKHNKGGVSFVGWHRPEPVLQSLPPTLRMLGLNPILSCSKGSRGLSV